MTFDKLRQIVAENDKQRYTLVLAASTPEPIPTSGDGEIVAGTAKLTVKEEATAAPGEASTKTIVEGSSTPTAANEPVSNDPADYLIRANQGHSIVLSSESLQLTSILPDELPVAVHGTFYPAYEAILESGYLSRMSRNHIHLQAAETTVISGMRADAEVLVFVDVARAVEEGGLKFWRSANEVVLTEGDGEGRLDLEYVQRIVDRRNGLGVLWQGGEVVRELPAHLKGRKLPMGKRGRGGGRGGGGRGEGRKYGRGGGGGVEERAIDAGDP